MKKKFMNKGRFGRRNISVANTHHQYAFPQRETMPTAARTHQNESMLTNKDVPITIGDSRADTYSGLN
jgi:hypothetical protein